MLLTRVYRDKKQHLPLPLGSTEIEGTRGAIPLTRLSENKLRSRLWPRRGYWGWGSRDKKGFRRRKTRPDASGNGLDRLCWRWSQVLEGCLQQ